MSLVPSSVVTGRLITLLYGEPLADQVPFLGRFSVTLDGELASLASLDLEAASGTLTLRLEEPVEPGQIVELYYDSAISDDPAALALAFANFEPVQSFEALPTENETEAPESELPEEPEDELPLEPIDEAPEPGDDEVIEPPTDVLPEDPTVNTGTVVLVLDSQDPTSQNGLYALESGVLVVSEAGLSEGSSVSGEVELRNRGRIWKPSGRISDYTFAFRLTDDGYAVIAVKRAGRSFVATETFFNPEGSQTSFARRTASQLPALELIYQEDLNQDENLGDVIAAGGILDAEDVASQIGLYKFGSGAIGIASANLAEGDSPTSVTNLTKRGRDFKTGRLDNDDVIAVRSIEGGFAVVESRISERRGQFRASATETQFGSDGEVTSMSRLRGSMIIDLEDDYGQDLTGEGDIGDSIAEVLDFEDATLTIGLYQTNGGSVIVSESNLGVGETPVAPISLTSRGRSFRTGRVDGDDVIAVRQNGDGYAVIVSRITGSRVSATETIFDSSGNALSSVRLRDVLSLENLYDEDLNGDGDIGESIDTVWDESDKSFLIGLYQMASGSFVISEADLFPGDSPSVPVLLQQNGRAWSPGRGLAEEDVLAVRSTRDGYAVVWSQPSGNSASATEFLFASDGSLLSSQRTSSSELLRLEDLYDQNLDFDPDDEIGPVITQVIDESDPDGLVGVYKLGQSADPGYVIAESDLGVLDNPNETLYLYAGGQSSDLWSPNTTFEAGGIRQDESGYAILLASGEGAAASGIEYIFNGQGDLISSTNKSASEIQDAEDTYDQDLNQDGQVGDGRDSRPPEVTDLSINERLLTITLNEPLSTTQPSLERFSVSVNGSPVRITNAVVAASTGVVTLTLDSPVIAEDVVNLSYTDRSAGDDAVEVIEDLAGNDLPTFSSRLVDNRTPISRATVSVTASDAQAAETLPGQSTNPGTFTFTRSGGTIGRSLTVSYAVSGTATNSVDYSALSGTITFAPGATEATVSVRPVDDSTVEESETVIVSLIGGNDYDIARVTSSSDPTGSGSVGSQATSATVTIADNDQAPQTEVTINSSDTGWHDSSGRHESTNDNYYAGTTYNNWFTFDIPSNIGTITSATLKVTPYEYGGGDQETYKLYDVLTNTSELTRTRSTNDTVGANIYNDLESGTSYGIRTFTPADNRSAPVSIALNTAAVADITAKRGQTFALGGDLETASGGDYIFGYSHENRTPTTVQLILSTGAADTTGPAYRSSEVNGRDLTIYFDEELAPTSPTVARFGVNVNGSSVEVSSVSVNASAGSVSLTLANAVTDTQNVTVAYTDLNSGDDQSGIIEDTLGNDAPSFTPQTVTNNTPPPLNGDDFSNDINTTGRLPVNTSTTGNIEEGRDQDWFRMELVEGTDYVFTQTGDTLSDPLLTLRDGDGNFIASNDDSGGTLNSRIEYTAGFSGTYFLDAGSFSTRTGTYTVASTGTADTTAPTVSSAEIVGSTLTITFDEPLSSTVPGLDRFVVTSNGFVKAISSIQVEGSQVELNLTSPVAANEVVTFSYNDLTPGNDLDGVIQDRSGNDLASITSRAVVNRTGVTDFWSSEPLWDDLWGFNNSSDHDIDAIAAFASWGSPSGGSSVNSAQNLVAVIDTGVRATHEDFDGRVLQGFDFVNNDTDANDDNGHGTHCAGTIGAGSNSRGVIGSNPTAKILPVKVLNSSGSGTWSAVVQGVNYAVSRGAKVLSMSLGSGPGATPVTSLRTALEQAGNAGAISVIAAGNDNNDNDIRPSYPASFDVPSIISVAASTPSDTRASFSSYGQNSVDLYAPGTGIVSTYNSGNSSYATLSGTSMATPLVAGALSAWWSRNTGASNTAAKQRVMSSVEQLSFTRDTVTGGRLNMASMFGLNPDLDSAAELSESLAAAKSAEAASAEDTQDTPTLITADTITNYSSDALTQTMFAVLAGSRSERTQTASSVEAKVENDKGIYKSIKSFDAMDSLGNSVAILKFEDNADRETVIQRLLSTGMYVGFENDGVVTAV